jgi:nitrite reductase/ring-hydroxylating ferredoxin subunit
MRCGSRPPTRRTALCRLADIAVPGAKGFSLGDGVDDHEIFVVRDASGVYAYDNVCPHTGGPLDWTPDRFLTLDRRRILCATHGAEFRIADGYCLRGPCAGQSLERCTIEIVDGLIVLVE